MALARGGCTAALEPCRDWEWIVLGMEVGGSETPDQPNGTDREIISRTPDEDQAMVPGIGGPPEMTR